MSKMKDFMEWQRDGGTLESYLAAGHGKRIRIGAAADLPEGEILDFDGGALRVRRMTPKEYEEWKKEPRLVVEVPLKEPEEPEEPKKTKKTKIARPPSTSTLALCRALVGPRHGERVLSQIAADTCEECFEALARQDMWGMRRAAFFGNLRLYGSVVSFWLTLPFRWIVKLWKMS